MGIIFKYLKPFALIVALCVVLLFGQAMCDLSLPNLMSDIVNVGIQKSGVEEIAPRVISEEGMSLMTLFMNEGDNRIINGGYTLVRSGMAADILKDFPNAAGQAVYMLNSASSEDVNAAFGRASLALVRFLQSMMGDGASSGDRDASSLADVDISQIYTMLPMMGMMPAEAFTEAISAAENADAMLYSQLGGAFTRLFYTELGADLSAFQRSYILNKGLYMLLIALAATAAAILVGFFASKTATSVSMKMRHDVFARIESFGSDEFDKFSTASLITRTTNDVQQTQMLIVMGIRMICYAPIMGIGGVVMAVGKSVSMSWIIALAVVILIGLVMILFSMVMPKFQILQKLTDRLNLVSRENLDGMMVIRAFGNQKHEESRFEKAARDIRDTERFTQRSMSLMMPVMSLIMNGTSLLIVWVGAHAIADSTIQIGDMMAFIQYAMQIIMSFLMMSMMFIMIPRASVSAKRIKEVLATQPGVKDPPPQRVKRLPGKVNGTVCFNNVSFRYHGAESDVLHDVSFTARPGETTAFIGSTGSGKSTLINLIPRFYDVTGGSITIDGIDVRDLELSELHEAIGYIPQKGMLFSGDIESNIAYGREQASEAEIMQALEAAQARDFVDSSEDGVKTSISQGGTNVSGGQRQRLAIARALVKKPPIYIFDDSFSALDFKTDAALRRALGGYTGGATVLIVAQRVSTIMNAEQIIVLNEGVIVGKGTHAELLESCSEYREIAQSQLAMSSSKEAAI